MHERIPQYVMMPSYNTECMKASFSSNKSCFLEFVHIIINLMFQFLMGECCSNYRTYNAPDLFVA